MSLDLLKTPERALELRLEQDPDPWLVPLAGYFFLAFAEGHQSFAERHVGWTPSLVIIASAAITGLVGLWANLVGYGGLLHLSARILRGQKGLALSVRAVGYALFWPGLLAATAAAMTTLLRGSGRTTVVACLLLQVAAGLWGLWVVIAAIRVRHRFSWGRAAAAWFLMVLLVLAVGIPIVLMSLPRLN